MGLNHEHHIQFYIESTGDVITDVWYDFFADTVRFKNYSDDIFLIPFGRTPDSVVLKYDVLENLLAEEYCVPKQRYNIDEYLASIGLIEYDPIEIVRKTGGYMANWPVRIRFIY